jgi:hypothetical protein
MIVGVNSLEGSSGIVDTNTTYEVRASWVGEETYTAISSIDVVSTPTPSILFLAGEVGAWYDPSDITTLSQDVAGTIPVTAFGQPVARMLDKSGNGHHALQATAGFCPTYAQSAGLPSLLFDGVDDFMSTASIDFTAADEMTVVSGFKRSSNAAGGVIAELGTTGLQNGTFTLADPASAALGWSFRSRGTAAVHARQSSIDAAPKRSVLVGVADISTPNCQLRRNGALLYTNTGSQGTGNYTNNILVIGARNGTSLFLNGNLHGLVVRAKTSTTYEITAVETWMNVQTGAY